MRKNPSAVRSRCSTTSAATPTAWPSPTTDSPDLKNDQVSFRYKDYAHGNRRKVLTLEASEFIRRFLLHVLPRGFMRIRHYGLLANRAKRLKLAQARSALDQPPPAPHPSQPESVEAFWLRVAKLDIHQCAHCHAGRMVLIGSLHSQLARGPPALRCA